MISFKMASTYGYEWIYFTKYLLTFDEKTTAKKTKCIFKFIDVCDNREKTVTNISFLIMLRFSSDIDAIGDWDEHNRIIEKLTKTKLGIQCITVHFYWATIAEFKFLWFSTIKTNVFAKQKLHTSYLHSTARNSCEHVL